MALPLYALLLAREKTVCHGLLALHRCQILCALAALALVLSDWRIDVYEAPLLRARRCVRACCMLNVHACTYTPRPPTNTNTSVNVTLQQYIYLHTNTQRNQRPALPPPGPRHRRTALPRLPPQLGGAALLPRHARCVFMRMDG